MQNDSLVNVMGVKVNPGNLQYIHHTSLNLLGPITCTCNNARTAYDILRFLIILNYIQEMLRETSGSIMLGVV